MWPIRRSSSIAASASSGLTSKKFSESRASTSLASDFLASNSSASTGSEVRMSVTFLCSLTGIRDGTRLIGAGSGGSRKRVSRTRVRGSTGRFGTSHDPRGQLGFVHDLITVALLGQEELAMMGKVHLAGVTGDERVKAGRLLSFLGTKDSPQPLGLFLPAAERAGDLDHHVGVGKIDGEIANLRQDEPADRPGPELSIQVFSLGVRGCAGDQGKVAALGDPSQLLEILADDQYPVLGPVVPLEQQLDQVFLDRVLARQAELVSPLGQGIVHPQVGRKPEADLMALGLGDPAFGLEHAPRHVILLGPDQAEDVFLAVILADQGGREPEPAAGLDVGGDPEHGRRQQMNLVIDDQPPVTLVEQAKVGEV